MKPERRTTQAVTQVKVLSPEIDINSASRPFSYARKTAAEARIRLELVPSGDLMGVLDAFLGDDNWDSTADVVRKFLSQYLMERYENLESKVLDLYLDRGEE